MWKTVFKKELLENILSFRFPLFFLICAVLILASLYIHDVDYDKRVRDHSEQVRLAGEELAGARTSDLHFGRIPIKGFLQPSPLSIFAAGFETSLPKFYEFSAEGSKPGDTAVSEESVLSVFGKLDFVFILQMIVSLIVLLFASDLVAGEKEMGTLRAILSNSVPRHTLLLGKLLGGYAAIWLPFLIVFIMGAIVLGLLGFPLDQAGLPVRLTLLFVFSSLFLLAYFSLGLLVSASSARSRTSLVAILLVWIVLQMVIPRLSDMIASIVHPIPTETVISMQKSVVVKTLENEKARALGSKFEEIFGRVELIRDPPGEPGPQRDEWLAFKAEMDRTTAESRSARLRDIDSAYRREKGRQRAIANGLSLLSPSAAFTRLVTDLCGTGEIDKIRYLDAVKAHSMTLDAALFSHVHKTTMLLPDGRSTSSSHIEGAVDAASLPAFAFSRAGVGDVLAGNWGSLISLAFWLIAPFAAAYVRFIKYDVR